MIHPRLAGLREVRAGEPIRAEHYNKLVNAVKLAFTGPNVQITAAGYLLRDNPPANSGMKWVIVRPPIDVGGLSVWAEDAVRHPEYGDEGANQGRWIAASELPGAAPSAVTEYPVWPHRLTDHYIEYAWGGVSRIRVTQMLMAFYVVDAWYIHPDPPFLARRKPHTTIQTPCSPQEATP